MPLKTSKSDAPKPKRVTKTSTRKPSRSNKTSRSDKKQYVLDTNVLLHDPTAIFRFQEHDVYLPLVVLEELDRHKKGTTDLARNARQVTRMLDDVLSGGSMTEGFPLDAPSGGAATGRLYIRGMEVCPDGERLPTLDGGVADNQILACAMCLLKTGSPAVLVTKDINLRVKAMACDVPVQDYRNDWVLADSDLLPSGYTLIDGDFWATHAVKTRPSWRAGNRNYMRIALPLPVNSFLLEGTGQRSRLWRVESSTESESVTYTVTEGCAAHIEGHALISARNPEQAMSLNLLNDPDIDFVAMLGPAGTGKTLLAVAAGLAQVNGGRFQEVLITRATVPLGEDIGFLPGTEQEKMDPWLGGTLRDVFSVLKLDDSKGSKNHGVEIASMSFMRGRSFQDRFIIVDEAQNLTVRQMRALLTRAGEGSKVIVTGNLTQIDTPYLDEGSSGLAWAAKNLQNWAHSGHIIMTRCERTRLAAYVEGLADSSAGGLGSS